MNELEQLQNENEKLKKQEEKRKSQLRKSQQNFKKVGTNVSLKDFARIKDKIDVQEINMSTYVKNLIAFDLDGIYYQTLLKKDKEIIKLENEIQSLKNDTVFNKLFKAKSREI